MTRSTRTAALALAAAALLAACSKDKGGQAAAGTDTAATASTTTTDTTTRAAAADSSTAPAAQKPDDGEIAAIVLAANSADSASGELAKTKATNPKVKEFAQRMITDHGGVNKQAVALATRLHLQPKDNPTAKQLTDGGTQSRQQLSGLSGASFDRGYIDHEVEYHQSVLDAIDKTLIPSATNPELKSLLQQVRPAVQAHLDMAKQIQQQLQGA